MEKTIIKKMSALPLLVQGPLLGPSFPPHLSGLNRNKIHHWSMTIFAQKYIFFSEYLLYL